MPLVFYPTFEGECLGILQQMAFHDDPVYLGCWDHMHAVGICAPREAEPEDCIIREVWQGGLSEDLRGPPAQLALAKRCGLPCGPHKLDDRRLGVLVWYRQGSPIPPAFVILADERALSGDWGARVQPSAMAIPAQTPGKAYRLAHGRLSILLKIARFTGPLLAWHRIGEGGPVFDGFEYALGGLPVHATLELLSIDLYDFLSHVYGDLDVQPPFFHEGFVGAAVRVTIPPWPCERPDDHYGGEVEIPPARWIWPMGLRRNPEGVLFVDNSLVIADVTAIDEDPRAAAQRAISKGKSVRVADAQLRSDALRFAPHMVKRLRKLGYLK